MTIQTDQSVTQLLRRWRGGDRAALDALLPQVYAELKRVAEAHLRREHGGARTLQATGLVHETYLRLIGGADVDWHDRSHFFAAVARLMRQILVDHARARRAVKRDGGERVTWTGFDVADPTDTVDLLALDDAMTQLEALDERKARVVELRVFAGLEFSEISEVLGLSRATLDRDFRSARIWLFRALGGVDGESVAP